MIETYKLTKGSDVINITILNDGTIKTETDKISAPNHSSAEAFLAWIAKKAGGDTTRVARGAAAHHQHQHETGEAHQH